MNNVKRELRKAKLYLGTYQTSMIELFYENVCRLKRQTNLFYFDCVPSVTTKRKIIN